MFFFDEEGHVEKPEDMDEETWASFGKPHEDLDYDETEQPITVVIQADRD